MNINDGGPDAAQEEKQKKLSEIARKLSAACKSGDEAAKDRYCKEYFLVDNDLSENDGEIYDEYIRRFRRNVKLQLEILSIYGYLKERGRTDVFLEYMARGSWERAPLGEMSWRPAYFLDD